MNAWTLSDAALDALAEVGNIGTGNAMTALSAMTGKRIDTDVPSIRIVPFHDIPPLLGGAETVPTGILLESKGN